MLALATLALGLAACGSGGEDEGGSSAPGQTAIPGSESPIYQQLVGGRYVGTLTALSHTPIGHLDPGQASGSLDVQVSSVTQRTLYTYLPDNAQDAVPDLAQGAPQVSADGRTVTVHIKPGVRFSPPVDREVTAADVAYAFDRALNPNVATPYFREYFGDLAGAGRARGGPIPGVTTPNRYTIVFHLLAPTAPIFVAALVLPVTAPVPPEFARPLDAHHPTLYGTSSLVATGPYMVRSDAQGRILDVGYLPQRFAALVRNPNWNPRTDFRPAYLDRIMIHMGGAPDVIGRRVLAGADLVQNDAPSPAIVVAANAETTDPNPDTQRTVLTVTQGTGLRMVALNNRRGPFTNVNVRRAVWAALDRAALAAASGGSLSGPAATHFIYPGTHGFYEAGGDDGPQYDFNRSLTGDSTVAQKYLKLAGYANGRYSGPAVTIVGSTGQPGAAYAGIVSRTLAGLGFATRLRLLPPVLARAECGEPARNIDVCPDVGWTRDFNDAQTVLDPLFNGASITPRNNTNVGQVNEPAINLQMRAAAAVSGVDARAHAWGSIDEQLVSEAVGVPFQFADQPAIESGDVLGVTQQWNGGVWDYAFTSLAAPKKPQSG